MREIKFRAKRVDNGNWIYGSYMKHIKRTPCIIGGDSLNESDYQYLILESGFSDWNMPKPINCYEIQQETVGQYTGLMDKNGTEIFEGDIIKLFDFDYEFEVVFECGAFQLATKKTINWDKLSNKIEEFTGCNNNPNFCMNDNVVSLWEIYWNFNEEEDCINCCEVIGNIHESEVKE